MKVTVGRKELLEALGVMARVAPNSTTSTIYKCALLQSDGDKLKLSAQDESIGAEVVIPAQVSEPGMIAVPAKGLQERIALLPEADVTLACQGDEWQLQVTCRKSEYHVHGLPGDTFPISDKEVAGDISFCLSQPALKEMIRKTIFAVRDPGLGVTGQETLTGTCFILKDNNLRFVTTDTHRMAIRDAECQNVVGEGQVVVPLKAMQEVERLLSEKDAGAMVYGRIDRNQIHFSTEKASLSCRLIDQQYPKYERVLPKETFWHRLTMNREDFIGAVRRMTPEKMVHEKEATSRVAFTTELGSLHLRAQGMDARAQDDLECALEGDGEVRFACNAEYLLDALNALETDDVALELTDPLKPILVKGVGMDGSYTLIVMPINADNL